MTTYRGRILIEFDADTQKQADVRFLRIYEMLEKREASWRFNLFAGDWAPKKEHANDDRR